MEQPGYEAAVSHAGIVVKTTKLRYLNLPLLCRSDICAALKPEIWEIWQIREATSYRHAVTCIHMHPLLRNCDVAGNCGSYGSWLQGHYDLNPEGAGFECRLDRAQTHLKHTKLVKTSARRREVRLSTPSAETQVQGSLDVDFRFQRHHRHWVTQLSLPSPGLRIPSWCVVAARI